MQPFSLAQRLHRRMPICIGVLALLTALFCQQHWVYVLLILLAGGLSWGYMASLSGTAQRPAGKYQGLFSIFRMGLMGWCVASLWRMWLQPSATLTAYLLPTGLQQNIMGILVIAAFFSYKLCMLPEFWTQGWQPGLKQLKSAAQKPPLS